MTQQKILFLVLFFAVMLSTWLTFSIKENNNVAMDTNENNLDAFATEIHLTRMDKTGHINASLYSPQLTHYPLENQTQLQSPTVIVYVKNQPSWKITANQAALFHGSEKITLTDHVVLHRSSGINNEEITVQTEQLTLYPELKTAMTTLPISLLSNSTQINSTGMQANFEKGILTLTSSVRGNYTPPSHAYQNKIEAPYSIYHFTDHSLDLPSSPQGRTTITFMPKKEDTPYP